MSTGRKCWATLLTRPSFLPGVVLLHRSLQKHKTKYPLVVLITPSLPQTSIDVLNILEIEYLQVEHLQPKQEVHDTAERLRDAWTKLRVFELVDYDIVVMLDGDMLVRKNMDELFDLELPGKDWIAASHACLCNMVNGHRPPNERLEKDCAYTNLMHPEALTKPTPVPPCPVDPVALPGPGSAPSAYLLSESRKHRALNSGLIILHPGPSLFGGIARFLNESPLVPTMVYADQDFLTEFFRGRWKSLGWQYNALKTLRYIHPNIWRDEAVMNVHYIVRKPWDEGRVERGEDSVTYGWWWDEWQDWEVGVREELGDDEGGKVVLEVKRWCGGVGG